MINLYPSLPLWWKRVLYTGVLCTIGANVFINRVENTILDKLEIMAQGIDAIVPAATRLADMAEAGVPIMKRLESSGIRSALDRSGLAGSEKLRSNIESVRTLALISQDLQISLEGMIVMMRYAGYLMWIPIISALYWMIQDVQKGPAKLITLALIALAVVVNIKSYVFLIEHFSYLINAP